MKKIFSLLLILVMILTFSACDSGTGGGNSDLKTLQEGVWYDTTSIEFENHYEYLQFNADGTFKSVDGYKDGKMAEKVEEGTYKVEDGEISLYYDTYTEKGEYEIEGDRLVIELFEGMAVDTYIHGELDSDVEETSDEEATNENAENRDPHVDFYTYELLDKTIKEVNKLTNRKWEVKLSSPDDYWPLTLCYHCYYAVSSGHPEYMLILDGLDEPTDDTKVVAVRLLKDVNFDLKLGMSLDDFLALNVSDIEPTESGMVDEESGWVDIYEVEEDSGTKMHVEFVDDKLKDILWLSDSF